MSSTHDLTFLRAYGATEAQIHALPEGNLPARVTGQERSQYRLQIDLNINVPAQVSGRLRHFALGAEELPSVGDWVACTPTQGGPAVIHTVLPRRSVMRRKEAGERGGAQIIAANIDTLFIATSLNGDLNENRLDRYFTLAWESGAVPVLLLTKADLDPDAAATAGDVRRRYPGVDVWTLTVNDGQGLEDTGAAYLSGGRTGAVVGSSGVGKSTLINAWVGKSVLQTQTIRTDDDRGRHTTTSRQMFASKWGGMVIDTPGMRELQLLDNETGLQISFADIEDIAQRCKFTDCRHETEPGCQIHAARAVGTIREDRWQSYLKQLAEIRHYLRKHDKRLASEEKQRWRKIHKENAVRMKLRGR